MPALFRSELICRIRIRVSNLDPTIRLYKKLKTVHISKKRNLIMLSTDISVKQVILVVSTGNILPQIRVLKKTFFNQKFFCC